MRKRNNSLQGIQKIQWAIQFVQESGKQDMRPKDLCTVVNSLSSSNRTSINKKIHEQ